MTTGIREFTIASFAKHLPKLGELGNTAFRKAVMTEAIEQFKISIASAATHYNHALKLQRATDPKSIEGLGRPDDKKGGRKPVHTVNVIKVKTGEVVAENISKAAAEELIKQAAEKKKAKLAIQEKEVVAAIAAGVDAVDTTAVTEPGETTDTAETTETGETPAENSAAAGSGETVTA